MCKDKEHETYEEKVNDGAEAATANMDLIYFMRQLRIQDYFN